MLARLTELSGQAPNLFARNGTTTATCPAHDDSSPSLSLSTGKDGRALLHCHAGCDLTAILSALDLTSADLFVTEPVPRVITDHYPYHDADGNVVYEVVRYEPKTFRQRRPNTSGGWTWNLDDTQRFLYRLPALLTAVTEDRWVIVVEGEKDADRLTGAGLVATTAPGGAGKWDPTYTDTLAGAKVAVIADNDPTGQRHANNVANALVGTAATVRQITLTDTLEGSDISDWLDDGLTPTGLQKIILLTPEWTPTENPEEETEEWESGPTPIDWPKFWERETGEDWLVEPLLPAGRLIALYAEGKAGKSLLALEIAAALATGKPILAQPQQPPLPVIYIDQEMTADDLYDRLTDLGYGTADNLEHLHYYQLQTLWPFDTAQGGEQLTDLVNQHQAQLVILDTVARLVDGPENDADTYTAAYRHTFRPLKAQGVVVLRLDHAGKDPGKGQRGSSAKNDDVDIVWRLTAPPPPNEDNITITATRRRIGWIPAVINITRGQNPVKHHLDKQPLTTKIREAIALLAQLGLPPNATRIETRDALTKAGQPCRNETLSIVLQHRRNTPQTPRG